MRKPEKIVDVDIMRKKELMSLSKENEKKDSRSCCHEKIRKKKIINVVIMKKLEKDSKCRYHDIKGQRLMSLSPENLEKGQRCNEKIENKYMSVSWENLENEC